MAVERALPSYTIRPGVRFPDWSAVTSRRARDALLAIFEALGIEKWWCGYGPHEDRVRTALLRAYAARGRAPALAELAADTATSPVELRRLLLDLQDRDLIVLDDRAEQIVGAYPFTDRETDHRVGLEARRLHAMCAIDALGAGAMYDRDVEIESRCRACGAPIRVTTGDHGRRIAEASPDSAVVWSGIRYEGECAATSLCTVIAFFCSDAHLDEWRAAEHPGARGFRLSMDEALQAGRAVFGPSLAGLDQARPPDVAP